MIIVKPPFGVSTPWAYKALDEYLEKIGPETENIHPDIDGLICALDRRDTDGIASCMGNILELAVIRNYPEIQAVKDKLTDLGAVKALMSGSGPTVFGLFTDCEAADNAFLCLKEGANGKFKVEF